MIKSSEIIDQKALFFMCISNNAMLSQTSTKKGIVNLGEKDIAEMLK